MKLDLLNTTVQELLGGGDNGRPINFWNDSLTQEHFEIKSALDKEM